MFSSKCEFLQNSGSFKSRGALNNILSIKQDKLKNGITTVSAGNHAIAASYVANLFNIKNKIFLYKSANQFRVQTCKNLNVVMLWGIGGGKIQSSSDLTANWEKENV